MTRTYVRILRSWRRISEETDETTNSVVMQHRERLGRDFGYNQLRGGVARDHVAGQRRKRLVGSDVMTGLLAQQPPHLEQVAVSLDRRALVADDVVRQPLVRR